VFYVGQESGVLPEGEAACRAGISLHQLAKCPSERPFHGLLASQLQCKHCRHQVLIAFSSVCVIAVLDSLSS